MSFFQRFFAALDGPAPVSSLDLVADEMRYAIFWTQSAGRESEQHVGGKEDLRRFVEAGGVRTWTHHLTRTAVVDGVEMVSVRRATTKAASARRRSWRPPSSTRTAA